ncbi:MAG: hypothetical protein C0462_11910 [Alcanivorax sp.]|nr:hypothetical protein [Alcanivorax sp.]
MKKSLLAVAVAGAASVVPTTATAEVSANLGIASQYLWRGQSLTTSGVVFGGLDYEHESGLYAGFWTSSEAEGDIEYDLFAGYAGEVGDLSYDVGYISYWYTDDPGADEGGIFQEAYLSLGFMGFGLDAFFGVGDYGWGDRAVRNKDNYYALSYGYEQFGIAVGYYDTDDSDLQYTHIDLSYEALPGLVFTASQVVDKKDANTELNDNLTFMVSYEFSF